MKGEGSLQDMAGGRGGVGVGAANTDRKWYRERKDEVITVVSSNFLRKGLWGGGGFFFFIKSVMLLVVAFSSLARILGGCSIIHSPPALFFFFFCKEISSRTAIPLFMPGSVHRSSAR